MRAFPWLLTTAAICFAPRIAAADESAPAPPPTAPVRSILVLREDGTRLDQPPVQRRVRSVGLLVGGVATGVLGLTGIIVGVVAASNGHPAKKCTTNDVLALEYASRGAGVTLCAAAGLMGDSRDFGVPLAILGGLTLAGGIGMTLAGIMPKETKGTPGRAKVAVGSPEVSIGPGSATLRFQF